VSVAEEGDFATELVIGVGVQCVEETGGWTGQDILREASEEHALEVFDPIFSKPRDMELQIRTDSTVGSFLSWGFAIEDSLESGFAVAEDGAAGMAGSFLAGCQ
jgi:hypothetical protein